MKIYTVIIAGASDGGLTKFGGEPSGLGTKGVFEIYSCRNHDSFHGSIVEGCTLSVRAECEEYFISSAFLAEEKARTASSVVSIQ
jgi:hypothetical protein